MSATKSEPTTKITFQEVNLIRSVEYRFGKKCRIIFWHGGGEVFCGRCSHMRALKAAREAAPHATSTDRKYNERAKV